MVEQGIQRMRLLVERMGTEKIAALVGRDGAIDETHTNT